MGAGQGVIDLNQFLKMNGQNQTTVEKHIINKIKHVHTGEDDHDCPICAASRPKRPAVANTDNVGQSVQIMSSSDTQGYEEGQPGVVVDERTG